MNFTKSGQRRPMTMLKQLSEVIRGPRVVEESDTFLYTRVKPVVRILNGALDEHENSPNSIVLNGRIDPTTLRFLKVDSSYQRPLAERADIFEALKAGII